MAVIKMTPASKDYIWGGRKLVEHYSKSTDKVRLAESWELSCHPDGQSRLGSGQYGGSTLAGYLALNAREVLGSNAARFGYELPILIKLIDAAQPLSIQVHPDNEYAKEHEGDNGKTEVWHIVEAEEDAFIYYGVNRAVTAAELTAAIADNTVTSLLKKQPVAAGETYFIGAGTIHAIGAGIVIAEIQQSSNVTYRLYDYDRRDAEGNPRPLHTQKGVEVSRLTPNPDSYDFGGHLALCEYFCVDKLEVAGEQRLPVGEDSFMSLLVTQGSGIITNGGDTLRCVQGDSFLLPASSGEVVITGNATIIKTTLPSVTKLAKSC